MPVEASLAGSFHVLLSLPGCFFLEPCLAVSVLQTDFSYLQRNCVTNWNSGHSRIVPDDIDLISAFNAFHAALKE
jgi:hypothetical protein